MSVGLSGHLQDCQGKACAGGGRSSRVGTVTSAVTPSTQVGKGRLGSYFQGEWPAGCGPASALCSPSQFSRHVTHILYIFARETETRYVRRADDPVGLRQNASHLAAAVSVTKYSHPIAGITRGSSASLALNSVEPSFSEHSILSLISMSVCLASSRISCLSPGDIAWSSGLCFLNLALCGRPVPREQGRKRLCPVQPFCELPTAAGGGPSSMWRLLGHRAVWRPTAGATEAPAASWERMQ